MIYVLGYLAVGLFFVGVINDHTLSSGDLWLIILFWPVALIIGAGVAVKRWVS